MHIKKLFGSMEPSSFRGSILGCRSPLARGDSRPILSLALGSFQGVRVDPGGCQSPQRYAPIARGRNGLKGWVIKGWVVKKLNHVSITSDREKQRAHFCSESDWGCFLKVSCPQNAKPMHLRLSKDRRTCQPTTVTMQET